LPSERSEDKLVFLINVQPVDLFAANVKVQSNDRPAAAERMGIDDESDQVP
jgi:hypothetical protein